MSGGKQIRSGEFDFTPPPVVKSIAASDDPTILTRERYDALLTRQEGRCAACSQPERHMVVDHDHHTGQPRGLLCPGCRAALVMADKDPQRLSSLVAYLQVNLPAGGHHAQ